MQKSAETADAVFPKGNHRDSGTRVTKQLLDVPDRVKVLSIDTGCKAVCAVVNL